MLADRVAFEHLKALGNIGSGQRNSCENVENIPHQPRVSSGPWGDLPPAMALASFRFGDPVHLDV